MKRDGTVIVELPQKSLKQLPIALSHTFDLQHLLAVSTLALTGFLAGIANLSNNYDDAFITFRYAMNLARGHGFVYNPGEWFLGTTTPLYGLLLGLLGWLFSPEAIPTIAGCVSGMSLIASAIAFYWYGRIHQKAFCGFVTGLLLTVSPLLTLAFGGEMLLQLALILWAFVTYRLGRTLVTSVLLALAVLTRIDSILAVTVIFLHSVIAHRRIPLREILLFSAMVLPFFLVLDLVYGSPFPGTIAAKIAQRESGLWIGFLDGLLIWIHDFTYLGSVPLLPTLSPVIRFGLYGLAGGIAVLSFFRFWILPLSWMAIFLITFSLLKVPFYHWYYVPIIAALMILGGSMFSAVSEFLDRILNKRLAIVRGLVLLALSAGLYSQMQQVRRMDIENPGETQYVKTALWLDSNTPQNASVGYFEIGLIGYFSNRKIIDPLGLVTPGNAAHVAKKDLLWGYGHSMPDYIIYNEEFSGWFQVMLGQDWFLKAYHEIAQIHHPTKIPLRIYGRR